MTGVDPIAARAFGSRAEQYEEGRPGWPADAIAALVERFDARTVLDLAAGTGKLTRILARHAEVIAVEPVDGMRRVLADRVPTARVLAATAEAIPLDDGSIDAVFVAEAFHWFDLERAAAEIARVLRPGGWVAVLWNESDRDQFEWFVELHATVMEHRNAGPQMPHTVPWREALESQFGELHDEEAAHRQTSDREQLLAQIASFSSIGGLPPDRLDAALAACRGVLERHGVETATLTYTTKITTAQKRSGDSAPSAG